MEGSKSGYIGYASAYPAYPVAPPMTSTRFSLELEVSSSEVNSHLDHSLLW